LAGRKRSERVKAIVCEKYGPPDVLRLKEVEKPAPNDNEMLVKVRATTVTPGDCRIRSFTVPPLFWLLGRIALGLRKPKYSVLGFELAGEIEAVGKDVERFEEGDQVFGSTFGVNFGAHAEYKCLPEDGVVAPKPATLTYEEAAAVPFGGITALHFLKQGGIRSGQRVLIYGASGTVGTYAVQLAKHFGAEVTGVCSTRNVELVASLGADRVVDYTRTDFTQSGETYDMIFDTVSKASVSRSKGSLKRGGVYLDTVMVLPAIEGLWYSITTGTKVIGGTANGRPEELVFLKELIEAGEIKPVIDRRYPLDRIVEAHGYVDEGHKRGNVIITLDRDDGHAVGRWAKGERARRAPGPP